MSEFNSDQTAQEKSDLEFLQKLQDLKDFAASFSAEDFITSNPKAAQVLGAMPKKLKEYLAEIVQIEEEKKKEKTEKTPQEIEEKRKKDEARIEKLAQEIFVISCASSKPFDKSMEFCDKHNLRKNLNEFGENGLSPLAAAVISGKGENEIKILVEAGANVNAKSPSGLTALDLAVIVGNEAAVLSLVEKGAQFGLITQEKEQSREREKEEKKPEKPAIRDPKEPTISQKAAQETQRLMESQNQAIAAAGIALELHDQAQIKKFREAVEKKLSEQKLVEKVLAEPAKIVEAPQPEKPQTAVERELKVSRENQLKSVEEKMISTQAQAEKNLSWLEQRAFPPQPPVDVPDKKLFQPELPSSEARKNNENISPEEVKNSPQNQVKNLPIQDAPKSPKVELAKILGISVGEVDINKLLFSAVQNGQSTLALLLVGFGGDVNHRENGKSVLEAAIAGGNNSLIANLSQRASPETQKAALSANPKNETLKGEIEKGGQLEKKEGLTPELAPKILTAKLDVNSLPVAELKRSESFGETKGNSNVEQKTPNPATSILPLVVKRVDGVEVKSERANNHLQPLLEKEGSAHHRVRSSSPPFQGGVGGGYSRTP